MIVDILIVSVVTGLLALDAKSVGNFQISLPIISAPLVGYILVGESHLYITFFIGTFISLLWLNLLPVGTSVRPDSCLAGSMAVSLSLMLNKIMQVDIKILIVISIVVGITFGYISRWLEVYLREFNSYLSRKVEFHSIKGNLAVINAINLLAVVLSIMKESIICFVGIYCGINILPKIISTLPVEILNGIRYTYFLLFPIGFANALFIFMSKKFIKQFLASLLLSFILFFGFKVNAYKLLVLSLIIATLISFIFTPKEIKA